MRTLSDLKSITGFNVLSAFFYNGKSYHLLIEKDSGYFFSHYIEGQIYKSNLEGTKSSEGKLPYKKRPMFRGNIE